jgi:Fe-S-cluster containining protein
MSIDWSELSAEDALRRCQQECEARCCRYVTLILPAPKHQYDYDEWSWFLAHENISIYFAGRRWHMEMRSRCRYLSEDNLCTIYEKRPEVCRSYPTGVCEYAGRTKHQLHFDTREKFDRWWHRKRAKERRRRRERARLARERDRRKSTS